MEADTPKSISSDENYGSFIVVPSLDSDSNDKNQEVGVLPVFGPEKPNENSDVISVRPEIVGTTMQELRDDRKFDIGNVYIVVLNPLKHVSGVADHAFLSHHKSTHAILRVNGRTVEKENEETTILLSLDPNGTLNNFDPKVIRIEEVRETMHELQEHRKDIIGDNCVTSSNSMNYMADLADQEILSHYKSRCATSQPNGRLGVEKEDAGVCLALILYRPAWPEAVEAVSSARPEPLRLKVLGEKDQVIIPSFCSTAKVGSIRTYFRDSASLTVNVATSSGACLIQQPNVLRHP